MREVFGLAQRLPRLQAQDDLRLLTLITFPNWTGDSSNAKQAAREGSRKRRRFLDQLNRQARGLGMFDEREGVDVLRSADDVIAWFGSHDIDAAA